MRQDFGLSPIARSEDSSITFASLVAERLGLPNPRAQSKGAILDAAERIRMRLSNLVGEAALTEGGGD